MGRMEHEGALNPKLSETWKALKSALARDLAEYQQQFGLYYLDTEETGSNSFWIMFQEGSDRFTGRRDIQIRVDFENCELAIAVVQGLTNSRFKIVADAEGNLFFERNEKRYAVKEMSREILRFHLSKL